MEISVRIILFLLISFLRYNQSFFRIHGDQKIMPVMDLVWGIIFALLATIMFNLAPVLEANALYQMREVSFRNIGSSIKLMLSHKKWVLGFMFGFLGAFPYFISLNFIGLVVAQPLMSLGLIVLVYAAKKMLHEHLSIWAKISIGLMILLPIFLTLAQVSTPLNDITQISSQWSLIIFTIAICVIEVFGYILSKRFPVLLAPLVGFIFSLGAIFAQAFFSWISFSGYDFATDIELMIVNLFTFSDLRLWAAMGVFILSGFFNTFGTYWIQIGLQRVTASKFAPIQGTFNTILTILGGIVIFGQQITYWGYYLIGIGIAILGTLILGRYQIPIKKDITQSTIPK
jgi:drug/metabolite transporter (DMT)-like permease